MKVSEITEQDVMDFGRIDVDAADKGLITRMFLPAAKKHIRSHTGLTDEEMDKYEELTIAVCVLCAHLYDNRSMTVDSDKENRVVREIIEKYSSNFIPRGDSG